MALSDQYVCLADMPMSFNYSEVYQFCVSEKKDSTCARVNNRDHRFVCHYRFHQKKNSFNQDQFQIPLTLTRRELAQKSIFLPLLCVSYLSSKFLCNEEKRSYRFVV